MKVLLIYPYFLTQRGKDYDVRPIPIGLYYLGAYLVEAGHQVEILNLHDLDGDLKALKERLSHYDFDVVGISLFNGNRFGALDCAKVAKELNPDATVIFGGVGATFLWKFFLSHFPFVDYVVLREGEETFLELLQFLEKAGKGKGQDVTTIKGLAYRDGKGRPQRTEERPFIEDLDRLPDPSKHFTFEHVLSSRGCPWNCNFCGSPRFWKRKVRFHSTQYFVGQLKRLYQKGVRFFYVSDDTFTLKKDRVIEICRNIVDQGLDINWYAISRVNCVDEDILYWMRRAGCVQISYGVESGSQVVRNFFNKGITRKEIERAFDLTRRYGMIPRAYFIYGTPYDTKKTIGESIDIIKDIKPLSMVSYILSLYPGTSLYEEFKKKTKATDDIWLQPVEELLYFEIDPKINREQVLNTGKQLKRAFYTLLPEFLLNLEFEDKKELYPAYSDNLSRLGLTFTHGDYAQNELIPDKEDLAERLFRRALSFGPNHDAFLGLGIILQRKRAFDQAMDVLKQGLELYSDSPELNLCMGLCHMNQGAFKEAIPFLERCGANDKARHFLNICKERLGIRQ